MAQIYAGYSRIVEGQNRLVGATISSIAKDSWKLTFSEQRVRGGFDVWREPFVHMRAHRLYNLRMDPFEEAPDSNMYYEEWFAKHAFLVVPAQTATAQWLASMKEFPIRQRPASFNLDSVVEKMMPRT